MEICNKTTLAGNSSGNVLSLEQILPRALSSTLTQICTLAWFLSQLGGTAFIFVFFVSSSPPFCIVIEP